MFLNVDINSTVKPFLDSLVDKAPYTKEALYPFVDDVASPHVSDILFDVFCQFSATESRFFTTAVEKYLQTEEDGHPVDYKDYFKGSYAAFVTSGLDPYQVWIERSRQLGMRPWLSFRMNDCHCPAEETCFLRPDFFYEARREGLVMGDEYGYFRYTFNYRHEKVRRLFLDYIEEQLWRYDVDGVELDFMREIICFDYLHDDMEECARLMTDFVRSVRALTRRRAKEVGHPVSLCVRLTRDVEKSLVFGFDAKTWAKEGLVDVIVPSPRWAWSDSTIPVAEWQRECPGVLILPCIETLLASGEAVEGMTHMTPETVRGHGVNFLGMGAKDLYVYNMFGEHGERDRTVRATLGKLPDLYALPFRMVVVGEETGACPKGKIPYQPFPCRPAKGESFDFYPGFLPEGKRVTLKIGMTEGTPADLTVTFSGKTVSDFAPIPLEEPATAYPRKTALFAAPVPTPDEKATLTLKTAAGDPCVTWVELSVE